MLLLEILLIAAGALLLALSAVLGKKQETGAESPAQERPPAGPSPEASSKLQTSLTELLRELHTLSNDMSVDLEEKLTELKEVLQLADMKLEEMSTAGIREKQESEPTPEPAAESAAFANAPAPDIQFDEEQDVAPLYLNDRYREIYQMDDEGLPIDEIARRMQMGKGEIQLILSLREKD